jgi:hypothetical protein
MLIRLIYNIEASPIYKYVSLTQEYQEEGYTRIVEDSSTIFTLEMVLVIVVVVSAHV